MGNDFRLKQFTKVDAAADTSDYIRALEAFDGIEQLQELKALARERGGFRPGASLLDVGCGFGLETLRLAKEAEGRGVIAGIDLSQDFIELARQQASEQGLKIDFRVGDALSLPYPDAQFDCVRAERLLIYLQDVSAALKEMLRVLKPGGRLALIEPDFLAMDINLPNRAVVRRVIDHEADTAVVHNWLPGQLVSLLPDLGFSNVQIASRVLIFPQDLGSSYFERVAENAAKAGAINSGELKEWMASLKERAQAQRLFATIAYFLFTARA